MQVEDQVLQTPYCRGYFGYHEYLSGALWARLLYIVGSERKTQWSLSYTRKVRTAGEQGFGCWTTGCEGRWARVSPAVSGGRRKRYRGLIRVGRKSVKKNVESQINVEDITPQRGRHVREKKREKPPRASSSSRRSPFRLGFSRLARVRGRLKRLFSHRRTFSLVLPGWMLGQNLWPLYHFTGLAEPVYRRRGGHTRRTRSPRGGSLLPHRLWTLALESSAGAGLRRFSIPRGSTRSSSSETLETMTRTRTTSRRDEVRNSWNFNVRTNLTPNTLCQSYDTRFPCSLSARPPRPHPACASSETLLLFSFYSLSFLVLFFFFSFNCLARKYRHYLVFDLWNLIYNFEVGCLYKNLEDPADPDCCKSPPSPPSRKWRMFGKTSLLVGKWDFQTGSRIFLLNIQKTEYPVFQFDSS